MEIQSLEEQAKKMQAMTVNELIKHLTGNIQGKVSNVRQENTTNTDKKGGTQEEKSFKIKQDINYTPEP